MIHIRYKNSSTDPDKVYVVVNTTDWTLPLDQHPSIIEHPEAFEIVDCEIPLKHDTLNYISDANN